MKKVFFSVIVFCVLAVCFINMAEAKYSLATAIRVYGPGEFAVKGLVQEQALAFIELWTKKPAQILIEGSADKKGDAAFNDKIGKLRADEMKAFFEEKFPNAKIVARSIGDQFDVRQVQISVEFEVETKGQVSDSKQKEKSFNAFIAFLTCLTIIIIPTVVILISQRVNREKKEENPVEEIRERWITGRAWDGLEYSVRVMQKKTGECVAPFSKKGAHDFEERDNFQAMKKCVHSWMKNQDNLTDFSWLKNKGIIVVGRMEE